MRLSLASWSVVLASSLSLFGQLVVADSGLTEIHEAGRCAIRGHCGKQGFFGSDLPCPDNGLAREPSAKLRDRLTDLCGEKWKDSAVCCEDEQVRYSKLP